MAKLEFMLVQCQSRYFVGHPKYIAFASIGKIFAAEYIMKSFNMGKMYFEANGGETCGYSL